METNDEKSFNPEEENKQNSPHDNATGEAVEQEENEIENQDGQELSPDILKRKIETLTKDIFKTRAKSKALQEENALLKAENLKLGTERLFNKYQYLLQEDKDLVLSFDNLTDREKWAKVLQDKNKTKIKDTPFIGHGDNNKSAPRVDNGIPLFSRRNNNKRK